MKLTKKQIARSVQQKIDVPLKQSYQLVETTLEIIKSTLASGEEVLVSSFGKFKVNEKNARKGRNPMTGEEIQIAAKTVLKFGVNKAAKDALL